MRLLITGTPGVGKTTLAKAIAAHFNCSHIDISQFIVENENYKDFNKNWDTYEFDEEEVGKKVKKFIKNKIKENKVNDFVLDTHTPSTLEKIKIDKVIILRLKTDILYQRLKKRGYSDKKIRENIECEIFGVIEEECFEIFNPKLIKVIDCTEMNEKVLFDNIISNLKE